MAGAAVSAAKYVTVDFQVIGKVQGVFFRKHTHQEAQKLRLVGWVMNAQDGSVVGQAQGSEDKIKMFKNWLEKVGSPKSKIERAEFKNEKTVNTLQFTAFDIRK